MYRLHKALYRLRQAPRLSMEKLMPILKNVGLRRATVKQLCIQRKKKVQE